MTRSAPDRKSDALCHYLGVIPKILAQCIALLLRPKQRITPPFDP
ncbi:MAG: hypothetical protein AAFR31_02595 [Cyanobacteria bacterium J06627_8]